MRIFATTSRIERQIDAHRRTDPWFALEFDGTPVLGHQPVCDAETQPGPLTRSKGEEGIEHMSQVPRVDPTAVVLEGKPGGLSHTDGLQDDVIGPGVDRILKERKHEEQRSIFDSTLCHARVL